MPIRAVPVIALALILAPACSAVGQDMQSMPGMPQAPAAPNPPATAPAASAPSASPPRSPEPSKSHPKTGSEPEGGAMPGMTMDRMDMGHGAMAGMDMGPGAKMMTGALGRYPMTQDGSGTSWQPASTPMEGLMWASGGWTGMLHGYADLVYDQQNGPRGATKTFSESMVMAAAQHQEGPGTLTLRTMLSLDPAMGPNGYPLLLQTGETANGVTPLVDRQHPHDLFMELAGVYSLPVGADTSAFLYVGYPGEPALGPVTYMHRFSGIDDPAAPITHHWLDSTHISYGVITTGIVHGAWKFEGSVFNGREPDQFRWDFDPLRLDSYSGRVTFNPTPNWSFQTSYGFIHSPEQLTPEVSQRRTTASAMYNRPFEGGNWQTTFAWGRNNDEPGRALDGFLLETAVNWGRQTVFARAETVAKDDLFFGPSPLTGQAFHVSEATLGYAYDIPIAEHLALGLGVQGAVNFVPSTLKVAYGGDDPTGWMPFLRLKIL
jgi:hypothetical protein